MGRMKTLDKIKSRYYWPNQYCFCGEVGKPAGIFYCVHHMTMFCQWCRFHLYIVFFCLYFLISLFIIFSNRLNAVNGFRRKTYRYEQKSTIYSSALYLRIHMLRRFCAYLHISCSEGSAHIKKLYHLSFSTLVRAFANF